ncbi:hypothetical protein WA026_013757 [Henosepilachna vigintioctopunctata]|uniref:Protein with SprT-like domain at the N terminus n=1 Tax=Henosepilachna vigintioctopunctata TaxID=420089 RepID=A0AAW1UQX7_9CUCU
MDTDYTTAFLFEEELPYELGSSSEYTKSDSIITKQWQKQFDLEFSAQQSGHSASTDFILAQNLQQQFNEENAIENPSDDLVYDKKKQNKDDCKSIVDPSWEVIDPTPDVHRLFIVFNKKFFWGTLDSVCVSWSKRMKRCAGVCSYSPNAGFCRISLSEPLLKLRPRKDLVETLLHEMIHAYLFVAHNDREREGHGPEFHKHMNRINNEVGTNITVYHDFHDEVEAYLQHKWRCNGPCQKWAPYFGFIKRSCNRAPGPNDRWWGEHSRTCGGLFIKIESPESKSKLGNNGITNKEKKKKPVGDIQKYFPTKPIISSEKSPSGNYSNINSVSQPSSSLAVSVTIPSKTNNIHGFSSGTTKTFSGQTGHNWNTNKDIMNKKQSKLPSKDVKNIGKTMGIDNVSNKTNVYVSSESSSSYDVVRNHWVNKFPNTTSTKDSNIISSSISNKRKSVNEISVSKVPKLDNRSQDSSDSERVPCPVCNKTYLMDELNEHLDDCLNNPDNIEKECIVCSKSFKESDYEKHFEECLKCNFNVKECSGDVEKINCNICNNEIMEHNWNSHSEVCINRNKCPECKELIKPNDYDIHLANCLIKKLDNMNEYYSDKKNDKIKSGSTRDEERIDCLACGKNILKSELNNHLDECLNEVFQDEEGANVDNDDDKIYNCPICLKLVLLIEMNDHINNCLKNVDNDNEMEINKRNFLNEIMD